MTHIATWGHSWFFLSNRVNKNISDIVGVILEDAGTRKRIYWKFEVGLMSFDIGCISNNARSLKWQLNDSMKLYRAMMHSFPINLVTNSIVAVWLEWCFKIDYLMHILLAFLNFLVREERVILKWLTDQQNKTTSRYERCSRRHHSKTRWLHRQGFWLRPRFYMPAHNLRYESKNCRPDLHRKYLGKVFSFWSGVFRRSCTPWHFPPKNRGPVTIKASGSVDQYLGNY